MKITPKNWGQTFLHIDSFQKETVAGLYPPIGKQDNSLHDSTGQWANPQLSSIKTVPKKIPKETENKYVWFFLSLSFSHTNKVDHKNEQSLRIAKQIKNIPAFTLLEATCSSTMTCKMFILSLKNVFLGQLEGMAQWSEHLV